MPEKTAGSDTGCTYQKTHANPVIHTNQKTTGAYGEKAAEYPVPESMMDRHRSDTGFGTEVAVYIGICGRIKSLSKVLRQGRSVF